MVKTLAVTGRATLCFVVVVTLLMCWCTRRARHLFVPESVAFSLPNEAGNVTFTRLGRQAYGSEYSRTISLDVGDVKSRIGMASTSG